MKKTFRMQKYLIAAFILVYAYCAFGGIVTKTSNPFILDTRDLNPQPIDGWQILSKIGSTYNEELLIDDHGKVWIFYYESPGAFQPIYLKIFTPDAYLYLYRTVVGHGSAETEPRLNSIRAALNPITGDVWVALQGKDGGYYVVFDSTGTVKIDSTLLASNAYMPKLAVDKNGNVWFSWHTANINRQNSKPIVTSFNYQGDQILNPTAISAQTYVFNTDIAIDDSNRVWVSYESNNSGQYKTAISILNNDGSIYKGDYSVSTNPLILNTRRAFFSDRLNQRMWFLEKNGDFDSHRLHLFDFDLNELATIDGVGTCSFVRNEINRMEVLRFNSSVPTNLVYEKAQFDPFTGDQLSDWVALFDSTYQFPQQAVAYNRSRKNLKVYLVHEAQNLTKIKFLTVETGAPQITVEPVTISFDTTKIKADYKKERQLTIQNVGNEVLNVTDINSSSSVFSVSDTSFSLLPQQRQIISVYFAPSDTGIASGVLTIFSDDPTNPETIVELSGRGYFPTFPEIIVSPPTLIFDEVVIGAEQSLFIYVQNNDKYEPLQIYSIAHTDTQFHLDKTEFTVPPRQGKYVNVTFRPVIASQLITDSLIIENNDPDTSHFIVPVFASSRAPLKPQIFVSPDSLNFGEVAVGESKTMTIEISNKGEAPLEITDIVASNPQFQVDSTSFTVIAQTIKSVNVTFTPQAEGAVNAQLTIFSNDDQHPQYAIPLVASGKVLTAPYLVYDKTELNFGKIQQGDTLQKFVLLQNFGDRVLKVYDFNNDDPSFRPLVTDTVNIVKGESYYLWVEFVPKDTMQHNDVLLFRSNDPNNDFVEINLIGKGEPNSQQLIVSFQQLDFGEVLINSQAKDSLLLSNIGNRTLTISNILATNPHFRPNITYFNLGPEQTRKIYIYFTPDSIKQFESDLIILSNDPVADSIFVKMKGSGRDSTNQQLYLSTDSLNFGVVAKNNTKILSLMVQNLGERKLEIYDLKNSNPVFSVDKTHNIISGKSFELIYITFLPFESIPYQDTLRIISNDIDQDTALVILTGQGREPFAQKIAVSDTVIDFGSVAIGREFKRTITIFNTGERKLSVFDIATSDSQFTVSESWFVLDPGREKNIDVIFKPESEIQSIAALTIASNDPANQEIKIQLYGKGSVYQGPYARINEDFIDFGRTFIGAEKQVSFFIHNLSPSFPLNITDYSISNAKFSIKKMPNTVAPGDSGIVRVAYHPDLDGAHLGALTIYANDIYNETSVLSLAGKGIMEIPSQNTLSEIGWTPNGSAPFGDGFVVFGGNFTGDVLVNRGERALFLKDFYLYELPSNQGTFMNLCFKNNITVIINSTMVLDSSSTELKYWNVENFDISPFLTLGRNRIAVVVRTGQNHGAGGGLDCELFVNNEPKIRRGDQNWNQPDARWWYLYPAATIPTDIVNDRLWFAADYGLAFEDTIKAAWSLEPSGTDTLYDYSIFGKNIILHGTTWTNGVVGKALEFSGQEDSYARVQSNLNDLPLNLEFWLNCYGAKSHKQLVFSNKINETAFGNGLFIDENLHLGVYVYNGEYIFDNFNLSAETWHLISVQYGFSPISGSNFVTVFVDGDTIGTYQYQPNYPTGPVNQFFLGGNPDVQNDSFWGAIDEFKIKNLVTGAPPSAEIAQIEFVNPSNIFSSTDSLLIFKIYPAPFKIISGKLSLFKGGELPSASSMIVDSTFWSADSNYDGNLQIELPQNLLDIQGLNFALELRTNYGGVRYPVSGYELIRYQVERTPSNLTLPARQYRMISVPYELEAKNVKSVLQNLEPYDPFRWRLFDWDNKANRYVEFSDTTKDQRWRFSRGKAFWLVTDGNRDFIGQKGVTPADEDYRIVLDPGWNMVSNPFPYPVSFDMMQLTDEDKIKGPYYYYAKDSIGWLTPEQITFAQPWEGYFVWNDDSVKQVLIVLPIKADKSLPKPNTLNHEQILRKKYNSAEFLISADAFCGKYFDKNNLFGASARARDGEDGLDAPAPPEISEYVGVKINSNDSIDGSRALQASFLNSNKDGYCWDFAVESNIKNERFIKLRFRQIIPIRDNFSIFLFDLDEDVSYNLENREEIILERSGSEFFQRRLRLVIGNDDFIKKNSEEIPLVPVKFSLKQNYPNPFNSNTIIEFSLPRRMNISLKIYNILGQQVKTLIDGTARGGIHRVIWDGKNDQQQAVPSGMYFVRIDAGENYKAVKKLLLIK